MHKMLRVQEKSVITYVGWKLGPRLQPWTSRVRSGIIKLLCHDIRV